MNKQIKILDCTLRDGGLCLEDASQNRESIQCFDQNILEKSIQYLQKSKIDIIELGSIEITSDDKRSYAIYQNIQDISQMIPIEHSPKQMYAALYRGPDTPIKDIPDWNSSYCEAVRVILRYSELDKSLSFCEALSSKGYKVFVQPMLTMRYSDSEIKKVIDASNRMKAYAVYFVDSYGYMQQTDIVTLFQKYNMGLDPSISIGFHAHNNMNLAFSNAKTFLEQEADRELIIDSCVLGLGQGAGNLQTEIIVDYMNQHHQFSYDYESILDLCELFYTYQNDNLWGYSIVHFLPARHRAAYKYAVAMRYKYGFSFKEIDHILASMPNELKQRYTPENLKHVLHI